MARRTGRSRRTRSAQAEDQSHGPQGPVILGRRPAYERAEGQAPGSRPTAQGLPKTGAVLQQDRFHHAAKAMISDFLDEARRHQAALDAAAGRQRPGARREGHPSRPPSGGASATGSGHEEVKAVIPRM